ncbi:MAG: antibiotic biosynthesis monooxygenase [Anaerolineae bacterium]
MAKPKHGRFGKMIAKAGKRDALAALMLQAATDVETQGEGCYVYTISTSDTEPDAVWIHEVWETEEAANAALQLEAVRAMIPRVMELVDRFEDLVRVDVLGGAGVPAVE